MMDSRGYYSFEPTNTQLTCYALFFNRTKDMKSRNHVVDREIVDVFPFSKPPTTTEINLKVKELNEKYGLTSCVIQYDIDKVIGNKQD